MKIIDRPDYLQTLIDVMGTSDIKGITGVHRSGRSKLLEAFRDHVVATELLRRGYELYAGVLYKKEIDFATDHSSVPPFFWRMAAAIPANTRSLTMPAPAPHAPPKLKSH